MLAPLFAISAVGDILPVALQPLSLVGVPGSLLYCAFRDTLGNGSLARYAMRHAVQPGSIPLLLMTRAAAGAVRNFMSALAASGAPAAMCTAAENTVVCWMSAGKGPR